MNSTSDCTNDKLPEDLLRRSISTPLRCVSDDEDEDGEKPSDPWVKAVGGTGDIGAASASGVCDLSEEEDSSAQGDDQSRELQEETDSCLASPLQSVYSVSYSDVDSTGSSHLCSDHDAITPFHWSWVVADMVYDRYGERMRRLRNNIEDQLTKFRSHTNFRSTLMCEQEAFPDEDVSLLSCLLKN
ncbi:uncharacterized protein LOC124111500 isoform X1 [Haliotis rufescens]|uniref:uncharacterized protein LOC124111500 isoform X1 n=1 Tax=Haliotis rufescens TaxID=6454 RepID=UPI001EB07344|nr:uncharacterized protein LOC124111500 isoform X1 [Haliotis rufescens]